MFARQKPILMAMLIVALVMGLFGVFSAPIEAASTITIVDSAGRVVELPYPLERVVVLNPPSAEVMRATGVTDRIIGISGSLARADYWPGLSGLPQVARFAHTEPDYEKIIELNPQAVITYGTHPAIDIQEIADALAPAGIKVVGIDCYELDTLFRDIATLGAIFGREAQAARLIVFFQDILDAVEEKVGGLESEEKPRVYAEHHGGDYHTFGASSPWHAMIERAGGINIFAGISMPYPEVDPEAVIEGNPQVILKDTRGTPPMGYGVTDTAPIQAYIAELAARPGWEALDAVRDRRVYVLSPDLTAGPKKVIAIAYFAKLFHPEFDLDPKAMLREYHERWQGVEHKGVFIYPEP
jgi:iron complex transport system substrate-binding protein